MNDLRKHCLGIECETARTCAYYVRKTHPHDVLFMPSQSGKQCHTYEPLHDDEVWIEKLKQLAGCVA